MNRYKIVDMVTMAMFAALIAVCSQISIPLPFTPVPINAALIPVFLCGAVMGPKGTLSTTLFIFIGICGLPVFAGFQNGLGTLAGPTGGFIVGYAIASLTVGMLSQRIASILLIAFSMAIALIICYLCGTFWFMFVMKQNFTSALGLTVLPFLVGDAAKIIAASIMTPRIRRMYRLFSDHKA